MFSELWWAISADKSRLELDGSDYGFSTLQPRDGSYEIFEKDFGEVSPKTLVFSSWVM
jgi:hypothetical protein